MQKLYCNTCNFFLQRTLPNGVHSEDMRILTNILEQQEMTRQTTEVEYFLLLKKN